MLHVDDAREVLRSVGLVSGLPLTEIHSRLSTGLRLHDTGQRLLAFYLHEMDVGRLYQATGHSSTAHYALARLGMDRRRTSELIAVGRKLLTLPVIDTAFCAHEIGWSVVLLLASVATPEHEAAWLARALACTYRRLALEVRLARPGRPPRAAGDRKGLAEIRFPIETKVAATTFQKMDLAKKKLSEECGRLLADDEVFDAMADLVLTTEDDGSVPGRTRVSSSLYKIVLRSEEGGVLCTDTEVGLVPIDDARAAAIRCDAECIDESEEASSSEHSSDHVAEAHRHVAPKTPASLRRHVLLRDGLRCRCCGSRRTLMVHHVEYRADGGPTCLANLITLCERCHGMIHANLLSIVVGKDATDVRFVGSRGRPVEDALGATLPTGDRLAVDRDASSPGAPRIAALDAVPDHVDASWWRANAHRIRVGTRGLEIEDGSALAPEDAEAPAARIEPVPFDEAFAGIVAQDALLGRLRTAAGGSARRGNSFPHTLFAGPAGTGKTTLARGISAHLGARLVSTSGPHLRDVGDLLRVLADVGEGDVLFLDEAHAVPRIVLESIYEALDARRLSLLLQQGARAYPVRFDLPRFTLVAATSEEQELPVAFRSRFGIRETLRFYDRDDLACLLAHAADRQGFPLEAQASECLAEAARGTPREGRGSSSASSTTPRRCGPAEWTRRRWPTPSPPWASTRTA
jgi:hypothetical protein